MYHSKFLAATALATVLAGPALAEVERVAKIDVTADLASIQNEQAAAFWATIEGDLENAIAGKLVGRMVSEEEAETTDDGKYDGEPILDGTQILIDISEVEMASALERELNLADAVLVGQVDIKDDVEISNTDSYELSVTMETAKIVVPEGMTLVLSTDTGDAYDRIVEAFAEGVVSRLK